MNDYTGYAEKPRHWKPLVVRLAEARKIEKQFKAELETKRLEWMAMNASSIAAVDGAVKEVQRLETLIRAEAVTVYNDDPQHQKDIGYGIGIRIMTRLEYQEKEALEWATKHGIALKLDTVAFEKIAEASSLEFVHIYKEPKAIISQNLEKVLGAKP